MAENVLRLASVPQETHTKHDLIFDGHTWTLKLTPSACGIDVAYVRTRTEKEMKEMEKSPFMSLILMNGNKEVSLAHDHIHPTWWWPLLFRTTEGQIHAFIRKTTKAARQYEKNKEVTGKFLQ